MTSERMACVDCGVEVPTLCTHVMGRLTEPVLAFQTKVISEVQEENKALRASERALAERVAGLTDLTLELRDYTLRLELAFSALAAPQSYVDWPPVPEGLKERLDALAQRSCTATLGAGPGDGGEKR